MRKIEEKDAEQDAEIDDLKLRMDEHDQRDMGTQMIVTGLPGGSSKDEIITVLNEKLETNLKGNDVLYALKLGQSSRPTQNRTRVVFKNKEKKEEIMGKRSKLRGTDLWLADALTPYRTNLAYLARKSLKAKTIEATWVYAGKVHIKRKGKDRPEVVRTPKDLPK
jgi:hypothetical protein